MHGKPWPTVNCSWRESRRGKEDSASTSEWSRGRMVDQHQSPVIACEMSYDVRM